MVSRINIGNVLAGIGFGYYVGSALQLHPLGVFVVLTLLSYIVVYSEFIHGRLS